MGIPLQPVLGRKFVRKIKREFVSGADKEFVEALRSALGSHGMLAMSPGPDFFRGNLATGTDSPSAQAALVVVGVKAVEMPAFK